MKNKNIMSIDNYKQIRSKMISPEATNNIVKNIAVKFGAWIYTEESRQLFLDSYEKLFDYWLNNVYNNCEPLKT